MIKLSGGRRLVVFGPDIMKEKVRMARIYDNTVTITQKGLGVGRDLRKVGNIAKLDNAKRVIGVLRIVNGECIER